MQNNQLDLLPRVFFFGRTFGDYVSMFDLHVEALKGKRILDCPAGPSAFACCGAERGIEIVACDSMYEHSAEELEQFVHMDAETAEKAYSRNATQFHHDLVPVSERLKAMKLFLQDYANGDNSGRYVAARLPSLPFSDQCFDTVLSSNLLFLYSDMAIGADPAKAVMLDYDFHLKSISELVRVCRNEVRIYPLVGPRFAQHEYLAPIIRECQAMGHDAQIVPVNHRELISASSMLRIVRGGTAALGR
jgi:hypothetical protein